MNAANRITQTDDYISINVAGLAQEVRENLAAQAKVWNTLTADELIEWSGLPTHEARDKWMKARNAR